MMPATLLDLEDLSLGVAPSTSGRERRLEEVRPVPAPPKRAGAADEAGRPSGAPASPRGAPLEGPSSASSVTSLDGEAGEGGSASADGVEGGPAPGPPGRGASAPEGAHLPGRASIWLKTFGCSHNVADGETMGGMLARYGYELVDDEERDAASLWLLNSCTVKGPSQGSAEALAREARAKGKGVVVAGCVPQGADGPERRRLGAALGGASLLGPAQLGRVVEAVEETLKGSCVEMLEKGPLPALDLPRVRRNPHVEIVPLSTGCLGACTYCKTRHARGALGSYQPSAIVARVREAAADPLVREIWLSSEDTGAYGRDLGTDLPSLLRLVLDAVPRRSWTRVRLGMTNPPYVLAHLPALAAALLHPCAFRYLHVPVQSGSDAVLASMRREYTATEFRLVVDELSARVPRLELATDVIVGFPGETDADARETEDLLERYRFPRCHISRFYPRPGTPAARMRPLPKAAVRERSRRLDALVNSWRDGYAHLVGERLQCGVVEVAPDGKHLVAHGPSYEQVLVDPADAEAILSRFPPTDARGSEGWEDTADAREGDRPEGREGPDDEAAARARGRGAEGEPQPARGEGRDRRAPPDTAPGAEGRSSPGTSPIMGCVVEVVVERAFRWHVTGQVTQILFRPPPGGGEEGPHPTASDPASLAAGPRALARRTVRVVGKPLAELQTSAVDPAEARRVARAERQTARRRALADARARRAGDAGAPGGVADGASAPPPALPDALATRRRSRSSAASRLDWAVAFALLAAAIALLLAADRPA